MSAAHWLIFIVTSSSLLLGRTSTSRMAIVGLGHGLRVGAAGSGRFPVCERLHVESGLKLCREVLVALDHCLDIVAIELAPCSVASPSTIFLWLSSSCTGHSTGCPDRTLFRWLPAAPWSSIILCAKALMSKFVVLSRARRLSSTSAMFLSVTSRTKSSLLRFAPAPPVPTAPAPRAVPTRAASYAPSRATADGDGGYRDPQRSSQQSRALHRILPAPQAGVFSSRLRAREMTSTAFHISRSVSCDPPMATLLQAKDWRTSVQCAVETYMDLQLGLFIGVGLFLIILAPYLYFEIKREKRMGTRGSRGGNREDTATSDPISDQDRPHPVVWMRERAPTTDAAKAAGRWM